MTPRQLLAYEHPCARAWETLRDEFRIIYEHKMTRWSTILTVNK